MGLYDVMRTTFAVRSSEQAAPQARRGFTTRDRFDAPPFQLDARTTQ
jgi:hypothetical protein